MASGKGKSKNRIDAQKIYMKAKGKNEEIIINKNSLHLRKENL